MDLSSSYFNFQVNELLEKEKNITIKAFAFDSPGLHITNSSSLYSGGQSLSPVNMILPFIDIQYIFTQHTTICATNKDLHYRYRWN